MLFHPSPCFSKIPRLQAKEPRDLPHEVVLPAHLDTAERFQVGGQPLGIEELGSTDLTLRLSPLITALREHDRCPIAAPIISG